MLEKEYKFLIDKIPDLKNKILIKQYYFDVQSIKIFLKSILFLTDEQVKNIHTVRVRETVTNGKHNFYFTAKTKGLFEREEFETEISSKLAQKILHNVTSFKQVEKIRYFTFVNGYKFEFDDYYSRKDNLKICEVEIHNKNESIEEIEEILHKFFNIKTKNVTYNNKYKNVNLAEVNYDNNN